MFRPKSLPPNPITPITRLVKPQQRLTAWWGEKGLTRETLSLQPRRDTPSWLVLLMRLRMSYLLEESRCTEEIELHMLNVNPHHVTLTASKHPTPSMDDAVQAHRESN